MSLMKFTLPRQKTWRARIPRCGEAIIDSPSNDGQACTTIACCWKPHDSNTPITHTHQLTSHDNHIPHWILHLLYRCNGNMKWNEPNITLLFQNDTHKIMQTSKSFPMNMLGRPSMKWLGRKTRDAPATRAKWGLKTWSHNYLVSFNNINCEVGPICVTPRQDLQSG